MAHLTVFTLGLILGVLTISLSMYILKLKKTLASLKKQKEDTDNSFSYLCKQYSELKKENKKMDDYPTSRDFDDIQFYMNEIDKIKSKCEGKLELIKDKSCWMKNKRHEIKDLETQVIECDQALHTLYWAMGDDNLKERLYSRES